MRNKHDGPDLLVSNGNTESNEIPESGLTGVRAIIIAAPSTLPEVASVQVSADGGASFQTLQSGGSDVTIPADRAMVIDVGGFDGLRISLDVAAGADRRFSTNMVEDIT